MRGKQISSVNVLMRNLLLLLLRMTSIVTIKTTETDIRINIYLKYFSVVRIKNQFTYINCAETINIDGFVSRSKHRDSFSYLMLPLFSFMRS